ncbi:LysR family transcriptional regulator [Heyndrickxia sp. NPDC080065]|uniref:LysR family transcriptional regulator n=1 Tax=Heyndrickxia sp. NPDC080065 TaxID=3390568 RepID=UPI003D071CAF
MTITQLTIFLKVAETGSFTKAGKVLHMTQPAVSRAISNLEAELDVKLIIRDRKNGIMLTDVGKRLLIQIREILQGFEKMEQEIAAEKGLEIGTIRIGAFPTASAFFLPKILRAIEQKYPNLQFELYEGIMNQVEEWLVSRVIDVGIINSSNEELEMIPFYQDKMIAVLRDDHPLQKKAHIHINDLDQVPLIICKGGNELPIVHIFEETKTTLKVKFVVHNTNALLNMIQEGLGVAIISELSLTTLPPNVQIRDVQPNILREINLAVPSLGDTSLAAQLFIDTAKKLF